MRRTEVEIGIAASSEIATVRKVLEAVCANYAHTHTHVHTYTHTHTHAQMHTCTHTNTHTHTHTKGLRT